METYHRKNQEEYKRNTGYCISGLHGEGPSQLFIAFWFHHKITTLKYVLFGLFFPDDYSCNSTMQWNKNWKIFDFCSNGHKINIMRSNFYVLRLDQLSNYTSLCEYIGFLISLHLLKMEDIRRVTFNRNKLLSDVHVTRSNINGFFYLIYGVKYITLGSIPL